jgi:hypothetical protein
LVWHRKLIARKYDGTSRCGPGRPRTQEEIESVVVQMAVENRTWGYTRIVGALSNLGYNLARGTVGQHSEAACHRTSTKARPQDDLEGIPDSTLGTDCRGGLFHHRGLDGQRAAEIHGFVLYRAVDEASRNWRNLGRDKRTVDESDCPESD